MAYTQRPAPLVALIAGRTKRAGKTNLLARCFPNALWFGRRAAIEESVMTTSGFKPHVYDVDGYVVDDIDKLNGVLRVIGDKGLAQKFGSIVVDDGTLLLNVSMQRWDASKEAFTKGGGHDEYYKFRALDAGLTNMASLISALGVDGAISTHLTEPETKKGKFHPGAPDVPSRNQVESVPAWADFVSRLDQNPAYIDPWWPGVMICDNTDPNWITGERVGAPRGEMPANLREVLRASRSARHIPRYPGLEWLDDWAENVADRLDGGEAPLAIAKDYWAYAVDKMSAVVGSPTELHVRWAVQDGIARHVLRRKAKVSLFDQPSSAGAGSSPPPPPPAKG